MINRELSFPLYRAIPRNQDHCGLYPSWNPTLIDLQGDKPHPSKMLIQDSLPSFTPIQTLLRSQIKTWSGDSPMVLAKCLIRRGSHGRRVAWFLHYPTWFECHVHQTYSSPQIHLTAFERSLGKGLIKGITINSTKCGLWDWNLVFLTCILDILVSQFNTLRDCWIMVSFIDVMADS